MSLRLRGLRPTTLLTAALAGALLAAGLAAQQRAQTTLPVMTVYKTPTCGCCGVWVDHVKAAGFQVRAVDLDDLTEVKQASGVPMRLRTCHTAVVGDYVVEGHVPADLIKRLLRERPQTAGIAVPGMPIGSPGMEMGDRKDPHDVLLFDKSGRTTVYARR
jgi:hypothetical protein